MFERSEELYQKAKAFASVGRSSTLALFFISYRERPTKADSMRFFSKNGMQRDALRPVLSENKI